MIVSFIQFILTLQLAVYNFCTGRPILQEYPNTLKLKSLYWALGIPMSQPRQLKTVAYCTQNIALDLE